LHRNIKHRVEVTKEEGRLKNRKISSVGVKKNG